MPLYIMIIKNKKQILLSSFLLFLSTTSVVFALQNPLRFETIQGLIIGIANFFIAFAIPLAVIILLFGAFYLITSAGNPEQVKKGKNIITYGLIGLFIILIAHGFALFFEEFFQ